MIAEDDVDGRMDLAGVDSALDIGCGQSISQPTMVATMTELLEPRSGEVALDVGLGSGWQAALLRECVGPEGKVYGIERIQHLLEMARCSLARLGLSDISVIFGDAMKPEDVPDGPFDMISCAAGSDQAPAFWTDRLKEGGRLVFPKKVADVHGGKVNFFDGRTLDAGKYPDGPIHQLCRTVRSAGALREEFHGQYCRYVPLTRDTASE